MIGQPYSGQLMDQRVQRLPDGNPYTYYAGMQKIWRDSQGRVRRERKFCAKGGPHTTTVWDPVCPTIIEVRDPVNGSYYTWDSINHVVHRLPLPAAPAAPSARQPEPNSTPPEAAPSRTRESLGVKTIDGVETNGTRYVTVYPTGTLPGGNTAPVTVTSEEWFAPDLQIRMLATTEDPLYGAMIDKFEDFSRSEPDPKLFAPPPEFRILDETRRFYITWGGV